MIAPPRAAGVRGMVGGQMMDLDAEHQNMSAEEVIRLQRLKTGEMFAVSCEAGAILGKAPEQLRARLQRYAHDIGLAFQITDDLLDVTQQTETLGKTAGKDKTAEKATYPGHYGVEKTRAMTSSIRDDACRALSAIDGDSGLLSDLTNLVLNRTR